MEKKLISEELKEDLSGIMTESIGYFAEKGIAWGITWMFRVFLFIASIFFLFGIVSIFSGDMDVRIGGLFCFLYSFVFVLIYFNIRCTLQKETHKQQVALRLLECTVLCIVLGGIAYFIMQLW